MNELIINIEWPYFLGIMGSLLGIAWYTSGRFTRIEKDTEWIKELLKAIKINMDNKEVGAFARNSPVALTPAGIELLKGSGIKEYIDSSNTELSKKCEVKKETNPYEVQQYIFDLFSSIEFPADVDTNIKKYAYDKGVSSDIIRRVGAIYYRDICLKSFNMKKADIDKHEPTPLV